MVSGFEVVGVGGKVECVGEVSVEFGWHGKGKQTMCVQDIQVSVGGKVVGVEDHVWIEGSQIVSDIDPISIAWVGDVVKFVGVVAPYQHKDGSPGFGVVKVVSQ